ncbi:hypothetical protein C8R46DRAFT_1088603 [Mycena filopes]|nr:hypothetical protein C8R46DRAFT_1088603 [Mycena filopes]
MRIAALLTLSAASALLLAHAAPVAEVFSVQRNTQLSRDALELTRPPRAENVQLDSVLSSFPSRWGASQRILSGSPVETTPNKTGHVVP